MSVRVALLGAGEFGALHASVLADLPGAKLAVVCDPDASRGSKVAGSLGVPFARDVDGVLSDPSVDAVVIASPEAFHVTQGEAALRAGKHALVEKPVALTSGGAQRLAAVAKETGKVLMPGHILRFVPTYALVKEQLGAGRRVHSAFARRNVPARRFFAGHQRTHTALMSLAHDLDLLLWYLDGQVPERVYAVERRTTSGAENPDVFWGLIEFSGGTVACVESLWTLPDGGGRYVDVELELSTDRGFITVRNPDDAVTIIDARKQTHPAATVDLRAGARQFGALREQLLHFVARIRGTAAPVVEIGDAVRVVALAEALMRSARAGTPLELAPDGSSVTKPKERGTLSQTVGKALRVLEVLGKGESRLIDISERLGEHKSTVLRLLSTLEAHGFVQQDEQSKRYSLGLKVLQLASEALAGIDLRGAAQEVLYELNDLTGETIHLGVYDEPQVVYIDKRESTFPIRMYSRVGARAECYCTGVGKAIIAFLTDGELERYLRKVTFTQYTPRTITSSEALREEAESIRARGYALDEQEHEEGVRCVAAPVFGFDGRVAGAVSVAAPAFRKSAGDIEALAPALMEAARRISINLGNSEDGRGRSR